MHLSSLVHEQTLLTPVTDTRSALSYGLNMAGMCNPPANLSLTLSPCVSADIFFFGDAPSSEVLLAVVYRGENRQSVHIYHMHLHAPCT